MNVEAVSSRLADALTACCLELMVGRRTTQDQLVEIARLATLAAGIAAAGLATIAPLTPDDATVRAALAQQAREIVAHVCGPAEARS